MYFQSIDGKGAGGTTLTAAGTVVAGMTGAAITTLATQVAIAIAAHPDDLGAALDELGSSANVRGLVSAILTGGVLGAMNMNPDGLPTAAGGAQTFTTQLLENIKVGMARAVIDTAIQGGSLEERLKGNLYNAFIDTLAAQSANAIGDMTQNGSLNEFTNKIAHAIAGCAAGALRQEANCSAGAIGAMVGEMAAEWYGNRPDTVQFSAMMASMAAAVAGEDAAGVALAGQAGANAAANNYKSHSPFPKVRTLVAQENARLMAECGVDCTQADFQRIDLQMQKLESAAQLIEIQQRSGLTSTQAIQLGENIAALLPFYGTPIALYQAITGESISGTELSTVERFFNGVAAAIPLGTTTYKLINGAIADMRLAASIPGMIGQDGKALMDFSMLSSQQKGVLGEVLGSDAVKRVLPDAIQLGRVGEVGSQGIDDLYKVTSANVVM